MFTLQASRSWVRSARTMYFLRDKLGCMDWWRTASLRWFANRAIIIDENEIPDDRSDLHCVSRADRTPRSAGLLLTPAVLCLRAALGNGTPHLDQKHMSSLQAGVSLYRQGATSKGVRSRAGARSRVRASSPARTRRSASLTGSRQRTGRLRVPSPEAQSAGLRRALLLT